MKHKRTLKNEQRAYYRAKYGLKADDEEGTLCMKFFKEYNVEKVISLLPNSFKNKKVLIVAGGGEGTEVEKVLELGSKVTVTDISRDALKVIARKYPECHIELADAEKLKFAANSFDIGLVRNGLHHLPDPEKGIYELLRVCREKIYIIDFQETAVTKLLKKLGISPQFEEAGNPNFHFQRKDVDALLKGRKLRKYRIYSYFGHTSILKFSIFNFRISLQIVKGIFFAFNFFFSRWGNQLLVAIQKS